MEECNVFLGISQSTTFVGFTPGLGFRFILLDRLFLVTGRSGVFFAVAADCAGGGGLALLLLLLVLELASSSESGIVDRVGRPS